MKRYFALCPGCGNERELSRSVVDGGRIPLCDADGCGRGMDVYTRDPKPKPSRTLLRPASFPMTTSWAD